ncbi:LysR family transcriptional regulator [Kineosporia sp. J2-2]|uniref:LysR family transcriptional regulator n=1 Tax=Kineosporia corallincola TaxID=2835133 RepID=A0ABS5TGL9_9ACTN|nr:LysR family transcriptional regulator [Kineosporia corallincola]MBT0770239.1 LysR family transcriptional regulator [Kineosporia corallincola]
MPAPTTEDLLVPEPDLRQLRYFAAVAQERNLTRAAESLRISQPALSRAIQALERSVGVDLLIRRPRSLELTDAGRSLLASAQELDSRMHAAVRDARAAGTPRLTVSVHICDVSLAARLCSFHDAVDFVSDDTREQADHLRSGSHQVALLRDQFDETGVRQHLLLSEPRVVILPERHRLADRDVVVLADLLDEPITTWARMSAAEAAHWAAADENPRPWRPGPAVTTPGEVLAAVRLNQAVAFYPASVAPPGTRLPGLVSRAVEGVSPSRLWIGHREGEIASTVRDFVDGVRSRVPEVSPAS